MREKRRVGSLITILVLTSANGTSQHELGSLVVRPQHVLDQDPLLVVNCRASGRHWKKKIHNFNFLKPDWHDGLQLCETGEVRKKPDKKSFFRDSTRHFSKRRSATTLANRFYFRLDFRRASRHYISPVKQTSLEICRGNNCQFEATFRCPNFYFIFIH